MTTKFAGVPISLFGAGAIKEIIPLIKREKVKKALIVTDVVLNKIGIVKKVTNVLDNAFIDYKVFDEVVPNPTIKNVNDGLKIFKDNKCDFLIAVGGGSANDCAKAINMLTTNNKDIKFYEGANKAINKGHLLVAINTTAGTGSETSRAFLINDEKEQKKLIFKDDYAMPNIAVNDTELMVNLPKDITAQTGMDALTHSIESLVSKNNFLLTDILAIKAIEIIYINLPKVVDEPTNMAARKSMSYAQYIAGLSFGSAGLGLVHSMAHALGAVYNLPHGLCNAILLPQVMEFYKKHCVQQFSNIAKIIATKECLNKTEQQMTEITIKLIRDLSTYVGTNIPLSKIGVLKDDIELLTLKTLNDGCILSSPILPTKDEVMNIFKELM